MIHGKTLQELALEVERQSNAQHDLIVPSGQMEMRAHNELAPALAIKGESDLFPMTETGHDTLASRLSIPTRYYERMRSEARRSCLTTSTNGCGRRANKMYPAWCVPWTARPAPCFPINTSALITTNF